MASKNSITGDVIATKGISQEYRDNYDTIFGKKNKNTIAEARSFIPESHQISGHNTYSIIKDNKQYPRGQTPCILHIDESPFYQEDLSPHNTINS